MAKLMESMKKYEVRQCLEGAMLLFAATSSVSIYTVLSVFAVADAYTSIVFKMTSILITLYIFIKTAYKYEKKKNDMYIALILILIPILCTMTIFSRGYLHDAYRGHYLGYFVCIPQAMLAGRLMVSKGKKIPWGFSILIFAMISNIGMIRLMNSGAYHYITYGSNYQILGYTGTYVFMFLMLSVTKFHEFFNLEGNMKKICKYLLLCSMLISVVAVVKSQGRGAQILLIFFMVYFLPSFLKKNRVFSKKNMLVGIPVLCVCVMIGVKYSNIVNLLFRGRLAETVYGVLQDPVGYFIANKRGQYIIAALQAFIKSPIWGNGLGSVYYEIGCYSHNIFSDILCEQGIIGLILFFLICVFCIKKYFFFRKELCVKIVFLVMFAGFFGLMLSGYYLYQSEVWFALGFFMTIDDKGKWNNE